MSAQALRAVTTGQPDQPRDPYQQLKQQLERSKAEFLPLMGNVPANVDRFIRVVLNAVLANPDLLGADRRSLIASCMRAAQDGLMPDGRDAVLNIYSVKVKNRDTQREEWIKAVQYLPMVAGLVKKLYAGGEVTSIDAACVYENDRFVFRRGDDPKLEHEPTLADAPGQIVAAYAVVRLRNGELKREVMPRRDILAVKAVSKAQGDNSPWAKWFDQQAIKSVIKRIYKQLPHSDAFDAVDGHDNDAVGSAPASPAFAATPQSVAEIATRHAIPHAPADTIDFGIAGQSAPVAANPETGGGASGRDPEPSWVLAAQAGGNGAAPATPTFDPAALIARMRACRDQDTLDALVDEARGQPADVASTVGAVYDEMAAHIAAGTRPTDMQAPAGGPASAAAPTPPASPAAGRGPRSRAAGAPVQGTLE